MKMQAVYTYVLLLVLAGWVMAQEGQEKFVPFEGTRSAMVELKAEATVAGTQIKLSHIARWSETDALQMAQAADLVVARFEPKQSTQTIDLQDLKSTLEGAGVNLAAVGFCGAIACRVTRNDPVVENGPQADILKLATLVGPADAAASGAPGRSLREALATDLADRIGIPADTLQFRFNSDDEKLLALREPAYQFAIKGPSVRKVGDIHWEVTLSTGGKSQRVPIRGYARMWQNQLQIIRPVAYKQPIRPEDVVEKRVLIDHLGEEAMLTRDQAVGQQAARDLAPNTVLTGRLIEAVALAKPGQLVTVLVETGRVQVRWVAEARESGTFGQSIRVRKPGTREEFSVLLTGPQQGKLVGEAPDSTKVAAAR